MRQQRGLIKIAVMLASGLGFASGCGSSGSGPGPGSGSVVGTLGGKSMTVTSAGFTDGNTPTVPPLGRTFISLTSASPPVCTQFAGNYNVHATQTLAFNAYTWTPPSGPMGPATAPGTFTIAQSFPSTAGQYAQAFYTVWDATCSSSSTMETGVSGTVTLTTVSPAEVAGTFDVTMSGGEHITGSFDAPNCPNLVNASPTCM
jgi:hypothetical protein